MCCQINGYCIHLGKTEKQRDKNKNYLLFLMTPGYHFHIFTFLSVSLLNDTLPT